MLFKVVVELKEPNPLLQLSIDFERKKVFQGFQHDPIAIVSQLNDNDMVWETCNRRELTEMWFKVSSLPFSIDQKLNENEYYR